MSTSINRLQFLRGDFRGKQQALRPPWSIKAHIKNHCLTQQGVICFSCRDSCEVEAIHFTMAKVPMPDVHFDQCNGCGACYQACPVTAIIGLL